MATVCYTSKIEPKEILFASLQICAFVQFQLNLCIKVMLSWYCTDRKYNKNDHIFKCSLSNSLLFSAWKLFISHFSPSFLFVVSASCISTLTGYCMSVQFLWCCCRIQRFLCLGYYFFFLVVCTFQKHSC